MIVGGADNDVLTDGDGADLLAGRGVGDYLYAGDRGRRLDRDVLRGGPGARTSLAHPGAPTSWMGVRAMICSETRTATTFSGAVAR